MLRLNTPPRLLKSISILTSLAIIMISIPIILIFISISMLISILVII